MDKAWGTLYTLTPIRGRCTVNILKMDSAYLRRNAMPNSKDVVVTGVSTGIGWGTTKNFQKFVVTEARNNGLSPEQLGEAVHVALSTAKPKARYAVVPQRFKSWTLPRLLPTRMLDAQLAKLLGLTKPQPASIGGFSPLMTRGTNSKKIPM
jgi:hypothetical protein